MSSDTEKSRLDDAARAGWLYFIAGNTQDEIARKLNVSRPTAQRLVSLSRSERLITFRLEHPIAACMELARRLTDRFGLVHCDVVPASGAAEGATVGIAESAAGLIETYLRSERPVVVAIGTGRAMRAAVDQIAPMDCPNHRVVSLVGNISPDGSASFYDALTRLAEVSKTRHYPIPLPVFAASRAERETLLSLTSVRRVFDLALHADLKLVGIGQLELDGPLVVDGFLTHDELLDLKRRGAAGEVTGWAIDADGRVIDGGVSDRVTSVPLVAPAEKPTVGVAQGAAKVPAIHAALIGRVINGLVTDEATAAALLAR
jgi:DNA-binding transcriptional regulator LsrR (DeoR family)